MRTNGWGKIDEILTFVLEKVVRHFSYLLPDWQLFLSSGEEHWFHLKCLLPISKAPEIPTFQPPPQLTPDHHDMLPPCLVLDSRVSPKDSMSKCSFQAGEGSFAHRHEWLKAQLHHGLQSHLQSCFISFHFWVIFSILRILVLLCPASILPIFTEEFLIYYTCLHGPPL